MEVPVPAANFILLIQVVPFNTVSLHIFASAILLAARLALPFVLISLVNRAVVFEAVFIVLDNALY